MRTVQVSPEHSPPFVEDEEIPIEDYDLPDEDDDDEELTPEQMAAFAGLIKALRREGHSDSESVRLAIAAQMQQAQEAEKHVAARQENQSRQQAVAGQIQAAYQGEVQKLQQTLTARVRKGELSQEQAVSLFESLVPDIQERYDGVAERLRGQSVDARIGADLEAALERYPSLAANNGGGARLIGTLAKLSGGQYPLDALAELFEASVAQAAQGHASQWLDQARESAVAEYLAKQQQNTSFAPPVVPAGGGASAPDQSRPTFSDWTHDLFRRAGLK